MAKILGVNISKLEKKDLMEKLENCLKSNKQYFLVTPNPEIILKAHQDEELFYILNQADISLADGFGLQLAARLSQQKFPRITGADLSLDLLYLAEKNNQKVVIINKLKGKSSNGIIKASLKKNWPNLNFLVLDQLADLKINKELEKKLKEFSPNILFCLFGSPWQEKFIYHNIKKIESLKIAIGVGGAFDFITKKSKRAPKFLRRAGFEWLWRLILQPKRFLRIFRATIIFTIKTINWRFILPHIYRKNVACLLYKQTESGLEIFIVRRNDCKDHWQLPQGGLDKQSIIEAGKRELREEAGTSNFTIEKTFKNLYKYKFKDSFGSEEEKNKHFDRFGYKGQKQSLLIAKFTGKLEDIKINFWDHDDWCFIPEKNLIKTIHPIRQTAVKIYLKKLKELKYE